MNYKTRCHLEKYICFIGLLLFTIGLIFIIFSLNKLNNINLITNTTNTNNITLLASWGLLLLGLSLFMFVFGIFNMVRYKSKSTNESLLP